MRRLVAISLFALALPALVDASSNPVVTAAKRTATAKSMTFVMSMQTQVAGQRVSMRGSGAQSGPNFRMSLRATSLGAVRFDAVLVRKRGRYVMYLRSSALRSQLPRGKSWLGIDLSKQALRSGVSFSSLVNVSQTFAPLEAGLVSTRRVGRAAVAGAPATRYRALVDLVRAARALPAYGKQVAAVQRSTGLRLRRVPYDVWIAGDGRIHRFRFSMQLVANGARGRIGQTLTYLSFDRPVRIAAPPPSQVFTP